MLIEQAGFTMELGACRIHVREITASKPSATHSFGTAVFASGAPWLRSYPPQQQSDILDVLFKPGVIGALQVVSAAEQSSRLSY